MSYGTTQLCVAAAASLALLALLGPQRAGAATLYWDLNGDTANSGTSATGTWDGVFVGWNSASGGGAGTNSAGTTSGDDLIFSSGTGYTAGGTISLSGARVASSITFEENAPYSLTGGTSLTIGGTGAAAFDGIRVSTGNNAANTISTALILATGTNTIQTAGTGVLTLSGGITGAQALILDNDSTNAAGITLSGGSLNNGGTVTNSGSGAGGTLISSVIGTNVTSVIQNSGTSALTLSGANLFSGGVTLTSGTLILGNDSAAGSGTLTLTSGTVQGTGGLRTITNNLSIGGNITFSGSENLLFTDGFDQVAGRTYTVNNTTEFSGAIIGGDTLAKSGTGTLVLSGSNTLGTVTVNTGGALRVANNGALGTTGSGTIVNSGGALELIGGRVIGAEALSLDGTGISNGGSLRNVSGNNSWAGTITLANVTGAHRINSDAGTLTIGAGGITETGNNAKLLTFGGAGDVTVTGNIIDSGGDLAVVKDGAGKLTLSGANDYDNGTTINGGTVSISSNGNLGATAGGLTFNGGTLQVTSSVTSGRAVTLTGGATFDLVNPLQLTGNISGPGGITTGGNDLILNRSAAGNNAMASINVTSGRLFAFTQGSIGTAPITVQNGGTLDFEYTGSPSPANVMTFFSGGGVSNRNGTLTIPSSAVLPVAGGTMVFNNDDAATTAIVVAGNRALTGILNIQSGGANNQLANALGSVTFGGIFSGAGGITKSSVGVSSSNGGLLTLNGASTYTGPTTVTGGTLKAGVASVANTSGAFGNNSAVTMTAGTLDIAGFNTQIGSLTGAGGTVTLGTNTLTVGGDNTSPGAFAGVISGTSGSVTKIGTGALTLSGANTYTGVTTISGGTLSVGTIGNGGVAGNLGQASNAAANLVIGNGTLQYTGATASTDRAFTITAGQTATFDITANQLTMSGTGAVTSGSLSKIGAGNLTLSGANAYTGTTTVSAGNLQVTGTGSLSGTSAVAINGGTLLVSGTERINNVATQLGGTSGGTSKLEMSGAATETLGALTLSNTGGGVRVIDFGAGGGSLTFASIASSVATVALQIWNWTASGGTADHLIATSGFSGGNTALTDITFFSDGGTTSLGTAKWVTGSTGELVPVPEPGALFAGLALLAPLAWRERRHWMRCRDARVS